jgi:hypothetical protein
LKHVDGSGEGTSEPGVSPGAGVGALIKTREWAEAQPSRIQVSVAPVRGRGVAAQLTLRF